MSARSLGVSVALVDDVLVRGDVAIADGAVAEVGLPPAAGRAAFDAGAHSATHLFNAMSPLHHRAPGIPGAVLGRRDVVVLDHELEVQRTYLAGEVVDGGQA